MLKNDGVVTIALIVAVAICVGVVSILVTKRDDAIVEEVTESITEKELGLPSGTIDLTPNSPEKSN